MGAIFAGGGALCAVLQVVGRRLLRDLGLARVDAVEGEGRATPSGRYMLVDLGGVRWLVLKATWERAGLPEGAARVRLEHTPVSRLVLTLNGSPTYR